MTAKEYLMQVRFIDRLVDSKLEQLASLRETATKATLTLSDMPRNASPNPHSLEMVVAKMIDLGREIDAEIDRLVDLKRGANEAISSLDNMEYQLILSQRYLCYKSWEQIAEGLGYSVRHVIRLHGEALRHFQVFCQNVQKCP
jgi:DNA-directed RNA polymerase specialized sigma subunit